MDSFCLALGRESAPRKKTIIVPVAMPRSQSVLAVIPKGPSLVLLQAVLAYVAGVCLKSKSLKMINHHVADREMLYRITVKQKFP